MRQSTTSISARAALLATAAAWPAPAIAVSSGAAPPLADTIYTSTRQVNALTLAPDGTLWVATAGGALRRDRDGAWHKFTRRDGLPSHEVRRVVVTPQGEVSAITPHGTAIWRVGAWHAVGDAVAASNAAPEILSSTTYRGHRAEATLTALRIETDAGWHEVPLPPSKGTHISVLLSHGDELWAALYGEGLWSYDGAKWRPLQLAVPPTAREITALAGDGKTLWLGTRRAGVWQFAHDKWLQHVEADEPYDHNAQNLVQYRGLMLMTTLEDGLVMRTAASWQHLDSTTLSSNAPRQMVEFHGKLYVRHGTGKVDSFDGTTWTRDICAKLPRQKAMAIAAHATRLCVAQWGGWSEYDGATWKHYVDLPELQGVALVSLYADGDTLWIGTQSRGLAEYSHATGKLRWHDERVGLPDDWITCMARCGPTLYAGTFVGGLARYDGTAWKTTPELNGQNVTALEPDAHGGLFIATRTGLWHQSPDGKLSRLNDALPWLDDEVQALSAVPDGVWVGTRTGLYFVRNRNDG